MGQLWLRVLERRAKLFGLDLERSAGGSPALTAEMMAELFGYDSTEPAIDVVGEEVPEDQEALELGSGD